LVEEYLDQLNNFLFLFLKTTLLNSKIVSLTSVGVMFLKEFTLYPQNLFLKLTDELDKKICGCLFGGRCELVAGGFYLGGLYGFDFPGMYATIMLGEFPTTCSSFKICSSKIPNKIGFYEVYVYQPETLFPTLPVRTVSGVFFITGFFSGIYYSEELDFFIENGGVVLKYVSFAEVDNFKKIFAEPVNMLLNLKKKNFLFSKKTINSIYGKLAAKNPQTAFKMASNIVEKAMYEDNEILGY
jgi:hypothetical protein